MKRRRWIRAAGRLAGAALAAGALLAPAGGAAAHPAPSRAVTPAEVEQALGLAVGGPDCAHAEDMAVRDTGQRLPTVDTCGYYLGGASFFDAAGVATVMRVGAADPRALVPVVLPGEDRAPVDGVGDWAFWRAETNAGGIPRVAVVAGAGSELIAVEIFWNREPRPEPATLGAALALTRLALTP